MSLPAPPKPPLLTLRGMTWSHPRGYDPMVATAAAFRAKTGVEIVWDKRSLQDFESFPVEELARTYDLIVIDHPHVGQITDEGCLAPLDVPGREAERAAMAAGSVGASYRSYEWAGRQWAFPIDAAAQVQMFRPDRVEAPESFDVVLDLARAGEVVVPMLAPHSLMTFFSIAGALGTPAATERGPFIGLANGIEVIERLKALVAQIEPSNFAMDPIAASEVLARKDALVSIMPYGYGYVSYALEGFRPHRLGAADLPSHGQGPRGSAIGGTGIAVSAFSKHVDIARDYAYWVASGAVQAGLYAQSGGQPGHATAWESDAVNAPVADFYRNTRETLELGWLRPRHNGYMAFQHQASMRLNEGLLNNEAPADIVRALDTLYQASFAA